MRASSMLLVVVVTLCLACSRKSETPAKSWYDAAPLLASLRAEDQKSAAGEIGVASLSDLPLYDLSLELEPGLTSFRLKEELYFTNLYGEPLDEVVLRIYANAVGEDPPVRFERGSCVDANCTVGAPAPSVISIKPDRALEKNQRLCIRLELSGKLPHIDPKRTGMFAQGLESLSRLGASSKGGGDYGLLAESDGVASLANFYAVIARRDASGWQRGEDSTMGDLGASGTSHVRLRVQTEPNVRVVSSGVTTREEQAKSSDGGDRREIHVVAALVRDFALLASERFRTETRKVGPVEVRSHSFTSDRKAGSRVLDAAAHSLKVFEHRFGRYPYADLDVVEAPLVGGAGGVEFSGLVTVATMLYRPMFSDSPFGALGKLLGGAGGADMEALTHSMLEFVTAHEVAHQYWPGLVGSDSRAHPWADESLAQYSALLYLEDRYGKRRAELEGDRQVVSNYHMMRLLGKADGKVDRPVDAFDSEIAYAGLVYGKGPYFFAAVRKAIGDKAFFEALRAHVVAHRFRNAPPRALVDRFAKGDRQKDVQALARRWLEESHGDADLGGPDLRKLLATYIGPEAAKNLGPEFDMLSKLLLRMLSGESSGGGLGGLLDLFGGAGSDATQKQPPSKSPKQPKQPKEPKP